MPDLTGVTAASESQVRILCGACHAFPRPGDFPKAHWPYEVDQGYKFFNARLRDKLSFAPPDSKSVLKWYVERAPETIPIKTNNVPVGGCPVRFEKSTYFLPDVHYPIVANVSLAHLTRKAKLDLLVCCIFPGAIYFMQPDTPNPEFVKVADLKAPVHAVVCDLDEDGVPDIVVADLGSLPHTNAKVGDVTWLRGEKSPSNELSFTPITLLTNVGRVADVEPIKVGARTDLLVSEFGHQTIGSVIYLENKTTDWAHPTFVPHVVDSRAGAIHTLACDLSGHGDRDAISLISQEHEEVVALLNDGHGQFREKLIYAGEHPALGSNGIQLVDLNHKGRLDVLYTAGDLFDPFSILREDQGIYWLENRGSYPFTAHKLATMYGCYRAVAADFQGNGRNDIVAVSNIPIEVTTNSAALRLNSVLYLQHLPNDEFRQCPLEQGTCYYFTCVAGDLFGDGRNSFVTGTAFTPGRPPSHGAVTIWRNRGKAL